MIIIVLFLNHAQQQRYEWYKADKGTPGSQNRLAKTQVQKPQPGGLNSTDYGRKNP